MQIALSRKDRLALEFDSAMFCRSSRFDYKTTGCRPFLASSRLTRLTRWLRHGCCWPAVLNVGRLQETGARSHTGKVAARSSLINPTAERS